MGSLFKAKNETNVVGKKAEPNKGAAQTDSYGYGYNNFRGNNFAVTPGISALQNAGDNTHDQGILDKILLGGYLGNRPKASRSDLAGYAMQQGQNLMNGRDVDAWTGGRMMDWRGAEMPAGYTPDRPGADVNLSSGFDLNDFFRSIMSKYRK